MASATRSSRDTRAPTYRTMAGTLARSDSTTELRPATNSAASPAPRGARERGEGGRVGCAPRRSGARRGGRIAGASARALVPAGPGEAAAAARLAAG